MCRRRKERRCLIGGCRSRSDELREAASRLSEQAREFEVEAPYAQARDRFIDLAQAEIESGT